MSATELLLIWRTRPGAFVRSFAELRACLSLLEALLGERGSPTLLQVVPARTALWGTVVHGVADDEGWLRHGPFDDARSRVFTWVWVSVSVGAP